MIKKSETWKNVKLNLAKLRDSNTKILSSTIDSQIVFYQIQGKNKTFVYKSGKIPFTKFRKRAIISFSPLNDTDEKEWTF